MSAVLWYDAANLLNLPAARQAAGWPDVLSLEAIAVLQYPPIGSDLKKREARRKRTALVSAMRAAVFNGVINVVEIERDCFNPGAAILKGWRKRNNLPSSNEDEKTVLGISRDAFADWWAKQGEESSKYILCWLVSGSLEPPKENGETPPTQRSEDVGGHQMVERRKKVAMINEVRSRWPSVETDIRHGNENGLNAAAKLEKHGYWNMTTALQWAKENGKLTETSSLPQSYSKPRLVKLM